MIQFSVQGIDGQVYTFNAEEGMTWEQWVDTGYNTHGVFIARTSYSYTSPWLSEYYVIIDPNSTSIKPGTNVVRYNELIIADYLYSVANDMGAPAQE